MRSSILAPFIAVLLMMVGLMLVVAGYRTDGYQLILLGGVIGAIFTATWRLHE